MKKYNPLQIEKKWQEYWQKKKLFFAKDFSKKPKKFILVEFPYPSGAGLHMGHLRPYVAADVYARYLRLKRHEVLFPIGWDAFGLPAENYALKMGIHPSAATEKNIKNAKQQMLSWGLSFDWSREINTTDPNYYKWTQWLFLQFLKKGLAYESTGLINWCPKDKTGLANEEVIDGKCERCGTEVEKKEMRQWYLRITAYAEKLLEGLKVLDKWPEPVKLQQSNWIGRKEGINITYDVAEDNNFVLLHGFTGGPDGIFFPWLKNQLSQKGFKCQVPQLPNTNQPTEKEQVNFVLQNCKFDEKTVLFGHSLGAAVAMKVLEKLKTKIAGLVLAGGFTTPDFKDRPRPFHNTFKWEFNFKKIKETTEFVKVLSDPNDYAVYFEQGKALKEKLDGALFEEPGQQPHFTSEEEPLVLQALLPQITCFTTRPDTNFGATFVVLGPEHTLLRDRNMLNIDGKRWKEIEKYKEKAAGEAEQSRTAENRKKTGVFTGLYCINQLNNYRMPVYVSDYVLGNVGTGAVVGVPGHDKRDFEFAQAFKLEIKRVVQKDANETSPIDHVDKVQEEEGTMVNSEFLNGLNIHDATQKIMDYMESQGYGKRVVNYKLRDWVFSRQRYWGEPIPIIHCEDCGVVPVPEKDLPVLLPKVAKYEPTGTGESPLAAIKKWLKTKCPKCGRTAWRETNTMPQWAGSSWYWLRYTDPKNNKQFSSIKKQKYWTPVDVYFGGMEHTTLHLLYSRFWNQFLFDESHVVVSEPFVLRKPHGIVLGPDGEKMSKSRGNVVDPQKVVDTHGADSLRMYELFLGPHEAQVAFSDKGIVGVKRFLDRVWQWASEIIEAPHQRHGAYNMKHEAVKDTEKVERALNRLIKKITEDIESFRFNTSISAFMEFHNEIKDDFITLKSLKTFLVLFYPFAPHLAEELNNLMKGKESLQREKWPEFDSLKTVDSQVDIVVQINGKVKGKVKVNFGSDEESVKLEALKPEFVRKFLVDDSIKRVIFVKDRLINLVI
ncbi:MAG: leucine--tRNA ligase [Candidatus Doudnabacteria bacterium]|nr:leucine--tRNA ligase [Candidatus Doudnabacteria bacterium]